MCVHSIFSSSLISSLLGYFSFYYTIICLLTTVRCYLPCCAAFAHFTLITKECHMLVNNNNNKIGKRETKGDRKERERILFYSGQMRLEHDINGGNRSIGPTTRCTTTRSLPSFFLFFYFLHLFFVLFCVQSTLMLFFVSKQVNAKINK